MSSASPDRSKIPAVLGEFGTQLAASGLLSPRQVEELNEKIESGRWPTTPRELAARLAHEGWMTEFQAKRVLANKAAGLNFGRYLILDRVGSGAMGRVFRAQHHLMGRVVALKVIAPELMSNPRVVSRFLREMRLVAKLDHPNVVRAFDADRVEDVYYIAMEYVPGKSLGDLLKTGPLPPADVIRYAAQAALGLGHAHEQGILHRDVKPSNLLLTQDRRTLKVLDLGLGALIETDPEESFRTADGIAVGTIDYMSPEQASGKALDGRSDLYSLACCMYHLMTGQCPFKHENPITRLALRIQSRPTPITEYLPDLPARMVKVLEKMLSVNPDERFQTGAEASEALFALLKKKPQSSDENIVQKIYRKPPGPSAEDESDEFSLRPAPQRVASRASFESSATVPVEGSNESEYESPSSLSDISAEPWIVRNAPFAGALGALALAASFAAGYFVGRFMR